MDERIARLKTSQDALNLAKNARQRGRPDLEAEALQRAGELRAIEDGYTTPAEQAIALALYAYEDQQSQAKSRTFRAVRTRQMLDRHGPLAAAERMVLTRRPAQGYEVLEDAGLQELSFESIVDRFPDEFSAAAVEAARARLRGLPPPPLDAGATVVPEARVAVHDDEAAPVAPPVVDDEARWFAHSVMDPEARFMAVWLPHYRETVRRIEEALAAGRPEDVFETIWKSQDNSISHAGRGLLKHEAVDAMRDELVGVIADIHRDGSPANFDRIVARFEGWSADGRLSMVPQLLIARAFSGVHPDRYHTTVNAARQNEALAWFAEHTGFVVPRATGWAARAQALTAHLDRTGLFDDVLVRNIFPWFVVEQLRARIAPASIPPGHTPKSTSAFANLPPARRVIALRHNTVQTALYAHLVAEFGKDNVWTEYPTGTGGYADAVAKRSDGRWQLYELKISTTAADVVRQAMGQLLEYGFRAGGLEPVKLVVVGECPLDGTTRRFIARLRTEFHLDVEYLQIDAPPDSSDLA